MQKELDYHLLFVSLKKKKRFKYFGVPKANQNQNWHENF